MAFTIDDDAERGGSEEGSRRDQGSSAPTEVKGHAHFGMSPFWELTKNKWICGP